MGFKKLPSNSQRLLNEIVCSDNPSKLLRELLEKATVREDEELRGILRELGEKGYISIMWADNRPYHIAINNAARTYEEQLVEYEIGKGQARTGNITIGNKNKIKNSKIIGTITENCEEKEKNFCEKHPVICGFLISLVAGIVLLFSFWQRIITFLERLF